MSDGLGKDQEPIESWLTHWETQCIDEWENENDTLAAVEERTTREREIAAQRLWQSFQTSASSISQLYKVGGPKQGVWVPFQNAASSVTALYKDGMDVMKKCFEMGKQYGQHRRTDELIAWTRNTRRHLRREELLGFLCGKNPPPPHLARHHHRSSGSHGGRISNHRMSGDRSSPRHSSPRIPSSRSSCTDPVAVDMQPFCDALALQGLNGAMSNFGIRNSGGTPPSNESASASNVEDIHNLVLEEITRHRIDSRKRNSGASVDHVLDSPTRKRSRLL